MIGTSGAKYSLSDRAHWPQEVSFPNWTVRLVAGGKALLAEAKIPVSAADLPRESYRAAQKALDLMSVGGGGHFHITDPWDTRLLWWPHDGGLHLRISDEVWLPPMPYSMFITRTDGAEPHSFNNELGRPKWHPSFRHFRRAQHSTDVFSAFTHTFLAFESLLEDRVEKQARDGEKTWLRRALSLAGQQYSTAGRESLVTPRAIDAFVKDVYEDVRCGVLHAKPNHDPILPFDAEAAPLVADALRVLTWHVIELAREHQSWAVEARPQMEHELLEAGQWLQGAPVVLLHPLEAREPMDPPIRVPTQQNQTLSTPALPVFSGTTSSLNWEQANPDIGRMTTLLPGGVSANADLGLGFKLDGVQALTVDVAVRFRFSQMVRTIFPERSSA